MAWSFFEEILYSSRVNTWPGPFLNELCVSAWSFFEEVNIKVELIHSLVLFRNNCVLWLGPFLNS